MNNGKYRLNYCDLYPETRRDGKKVWPKVAAALAVSYCVFFSALLLAH